MLEAVLALLGLVVGAVLAVVVMRSRGLTLASGTLALGSTPSVDRRLRAAFATSLSAAISRSAASSIFASSHWG